MGLWVVSKRRLEVGRLKLLLENAVTTKMLKEGLRQGRDGKTRIEEVVDSYGTERGLSLARKVRYIHCSSSLTSSGGGSAGTRRRSSRG
jgi:hypothetical protein